MHILTSLVLNLVLPTGLTKVAINPSISERPLNLFARPSMPILWIGGSIRQPSFVAGDMYYAWLARGGECGSVVRVAHRWSKLETPLF